jgi:hypothetical protein
VRIVLATWNPDKIQWLSKGFEDLNLPIEAVDPARFAGCEEDGETCAENAGKKAMSVGAIDGAIVVAEDSGLCCDGLGGFPGTHTARWAPGSDDSRAALLLEKLRGVRDRRARFLSAIYLVRERWRGPSPSARRKTRRRDTALSSSSSAERPSQKSAHGASTRTTTARRRCVRRAARSANGCATTKTRGLPRPTRESPVSWSVRKFSCLSPAA